MHLCVRFRVISPLAAQSSIYCTLYCMKCRKNIVYLYSPQQLSRLYFRNIPLFVIACNTPLHTEKGHPNEPRCF